jgi:hypothetical protein
MNIYFLELRLSQALGKAPPRDGSSFSFHSNLTLSYHSTHFLSFQSHLYYNMEIIRSPPEASSFVPLAEHQSRTPSSFYSGPPVLYHHSQRCKIVILERELLATPALNALRGQDAANSGGASQDDEDKEVAISGVDTWVTSE